MLDWFLKYRICQRDQFCLPLLTFNNLRVDHLIFEKVSQSLLSAISFNIFLFFFKERKKIFIEAERGNYRLVKVKSEYPQYRATVGRLGREMLDWGISHGSPSCCLNRSV